MKVQFRLYSCGIHNRGMKRTFELPYLPAKGDRLSLDTAFGDFVVDYSLLELDDRFQDQASGSVYFYYGDDRTRDYGDEPDWIGLVAKLRPLWEPI